MGNASRTSPDVDSPTTPKRSLLLHSVSQIDLVVWPPAKRPHPSSRDRKLPCCIRLHSACTQAGSLLHNLGARARHPHPPGSLRVTQRKPQPCVCRAQALFQILGIQTWGDGRVESVCLGAWVGWGEGSWLGARGWELSQRLACYGTSGSSHLGACFLPSTTMAQTSPSSVPVSLLKPLPTLLS